MNLFKSFPLVCSFLTLVGCQPKIKTNDTAAASTTKKETISRERQTLAQYETAYFASGCFWCVEAIFESVKGVKEVISGYAGGKEDNPTYERVGLGLTSHAEVVEVFYDPKEISFAQLVQVFFDSHDPTILNGQGPDKGTQYRSMAFYRNEAEKETIESYIKKLKDDRTYNDPIVTEVVPFIKFYPAEDYHQDYEKNNPNSSYIRNVSVPRLNRFKKKSPDLIKEDTH